MTNPTNQIEIITSVQRRRRWAASEKVRMVEETFEPGMTAGLVARRHGAAPNQLFTWRRLVAQGSLTAAGSGEEVVPASDYRALQNQVRELHRLLGKKTVEAEILKEALEHATGSKKQLRLPPSPPKGGYRGGSDRGLALEPGGAPAGTSAEADRSAAIAGRGACGADQGGDRRIADLRLPACSRHPQALRRWLRA
jgi:transposase